MRSHSNQCQQKNEKIGILPQNKKGLTTQFCVASKIVTSNSTHDINHLFCQHEGSSFSFDSTKLHDVSQEVTEIDIFQVKEIESLKVLDTKQMTRFIDHDIIVVSITYAENISGNGVACKRMNELFDGNLIFFCCGTMMQQII